MNWRIIMAFVLGLVVSEMILLFNNEGTMRKTIVTIIGLLCVFIVLAMACGWF
jgi:type III secretory pathway component EscS